MNTNSATATIARNSLWYGAETFLEALVFLVTSIVVARYLGPEKLGELMFFNFIVGSTNRLGGIGLASATRKYMSEYLASGQVGLVGALYYAALRWQSLLAISISVIGSVVAWNFCDPANRLTAIVLLVSITPSLITWIPSQANTALQEFYRNSPASFAYSVVYAATIGLAVALKWGMAGVASAILMARTTELVIRLIATNRRMRSFGRLPLPADVRRRIRRYCFQSIGLTALAIVVWDRSEILFLKYFSNNLQLAFYSIGFGLTGRLLLLPSVFGGASSATLMAKCSEGKDSPKSIFSNALRYLALFVFPAHLGTAILCSTALVVVYGTRYQPAVPAMIICVLFAIPRAFQSLPETVLQAFDRQDFILKWMGVITILNLALDALLIPHWGAVGAAIANGVAQGTAVAGLLWKAKQLTGFRFPSSAFVRIAGSSLVMAALLTVLARMLPAAVGLPLEILVGIIVFALMLRITNALDTADVRRLRGITSILPGRVRIYCEACIGFVTGSSTEPSVA
jgi:O-antigen/teichoic acid export membrane protein